ncbi:hypothetical protein V8G69_15510 [Gaetbulibacter sp. M235]
MARIFKGKSTSLLIVWGKNDEFFPENGAQAFKRDVKNYRF